MRKCIIGGTLALIFSTGLSLAQPQKSLANYLFLEGCRILNSNLEEVRVLPGERCLLLPSGDYISATSTKLRYYAKDNSIRWEVDGEFHHQMNLSHDGKRILVLGFHHTKGATDALRSDRFMIYSLAGQLLNSTTADVLLKAAGLMVASFPAGKATATTPVLEFSHFNSFYEIPPQQDSDSSDLRAGDLVLNGMRQGTFIVTPDLKRLVKLVRLPAHDHLVHDVQATPRGTLLYFNNVIKGTIEVRSSAIEEIMPTTGKLLWQIKSDLGPLFHSPICGSVQKISDDLVFFTHAHSGAYLYSFAAKKIVWSTIRFQTNGSAIRVVQQVKLLQLDQTHPSFKSQVDSKSTEL